LACGRVADGCQILIHMDGFNGIADSIKVEEALTIQDKFLDLIKVQDQLEDLELNLPTKLSQQEQQLMIHL